jgi:hypothetical protein
VEGKSGGYVVFRLALTRLSGGYAQHAVEKGDEIDLRVKGVIGKEHMLLEKCIDRTNEWRGYDRRAVTNRDFLYLPSHLHVRYSLPAPVEVTFPLAKAKSCIRVSFKMDRL